ncbi:MAG: hypothetical protein A2W19_11905 [Spirochaetes bacterium RBG_16_49_21]|nr:MAG: hypothetical protein A2W19_11905 [Spirochaetes bacterium RBG_16_49_21]
MGYKPMNEETIYQIFRRWHARQRISEIKAQERCDRKTIRFYIMDLEARGFTQEKQFPDKEALYTAIQDIIPKRRRARNSFETLVAYEDELKSLIHDPREGVKPKTAYEIIRDRDGLTVSYETFKRFARERSICQVEQRQMIRIEMPPGIETQIDYGKVGLLPDAAKSRNRTIYAFCGVLSHSRLPFVQFVYTQDQRSFVESIVDMFEYYGGVTTSLSMDNLKSGVLAPDLWDPTINKTCAEMAEHYGVFIDPCRVGTPTDKGKVERFVPIARELFRKLKRLHPTADIHTLNRLALQWCRDEYGQRASTGRQSRHHAQCSRAWRRHIWALFRGIGSKRRCGRRCRCIPISFSPTTANVTRFRPRTAGKRCGYVKMAVFYAFFSPTSSFVNMSLRQR